MTDPSPRHPRLDALYQRYLSDQDSARFITSVAALYTLGSLERLAEFGSRTSRRAATLALGFLADYPSNAILGRRLNDPDRGVRILAETGIRELWCRDGNAAQRQQLRVIMRWNASGKPAIAARLASELMDESPSFAEAWNQRAIAHFQRSRFDDSAQDCARTLELNPYHFAAAVGMGQCLLELHEPQDALVWFRHALELHPDLEEVRTQVSYLQRALEGK